MAEFICDCSKYVAMTTNFAGKIGFLAGIPSFVALAFRNGLEYRCADGQVRSALNWRMLCTLNL